MRTLYTFGLLALLCVARPSAFASSEEDHTSNQLSLKTCLEIALESNFEIQRAKERIQREHGFFVQARAAVLPRLTTTADLSRVDTDALDSFNGQRFGDPTYWIIRTELAETIFASGRNLAAVRGASRRRDAAKADFEAVLNSQILQVKERYFDLLLSKERLSVREQSLKLLKEELRSEQLRNRAGTVSDFNVLRAEVAVANAQSPLIRAANQVTIAQHELRRVLGLDDDGDPLTLSGSLDFYPYELSLDDALRRARSKRPELLRLNLLVQAQDETVRVEERGNLPSVEVYGQYTVEKTRFASDFNRDNQGFGLGVRGRWNIFDGLSTQGRTAAAVAERSIVGADRNEQKLAIDIEVRQAHASFVDAQSLVRASLKVVEQAREGLRLARSRLSVGAGTQLEVLDSEVALTDARTNKVEALHAYNVAIARLQRAMGEQ